MEERVRRILDKVSEFWGHKREEVPLPKVIATDESVIKTLDGRFSTAGFVPSKRTILIREESKESDIAAELVHYLRSLYVDEKHMLNNRPSEEFVEHLTTRGIGIQKPLDERKLKKLKEFTLNFMRRLISTHKYLDIVASVLKKRGSTEIAASLEETKKDLERHLEALVMGRTVDIKELVDDILTARNLANMFANIPNFKMVDYETLFELNKNGLQQTLDHWPYILAEFHVEKVKQMSPIERKELLKNIHKRFHEFVLEYLQHEDPALASYVKRVLKLN